MWGVVEFAVALGTAQARRSMAQPIDHPDGGGCWAAVESLATSATAIAQHVKSITQRLEDSDKYVGEAAVDVLRTWLIAEAVAEHGAAIAQWLKHSDTRVCIAAVDALKGVSAEAADCCSEGAGHVSRGFGSAWCGDRSAA